MKNLFVCLVTLISGLMALWIPFDGTSDPTPSIAILSNTTRELILNIKIHGMFLQDTTIGGKTYQRILIPQEITTEKTQLTRPFFFDRIYPNPTKGMIRLRFSSLITEKSQTNSMMSVAVWCTKI
ncbi:MAG: hypothetical protein ABIL40_00250 [candidate division WOR-3 bacterium]